jgi:hypothetical protein
LEKHWLQEGYFANRIATVLVVPKTETAKKITNR